MAKLKATPKSFAEAQQALGTKSSIRLGNNTFLERVFERVYEAGRIPEERSYIAVLLHNTHIVKFWPNGQVTLHTGGYRTVTTKGRINEFINGCVYQEKYTWYYAAPTPKDRINTEGFYQDAVEFEDGMNVA